MNWSYLFKHWFGTLLLGPFISEIIMYISEVNPHKIVGLLEVYPIAFLFSLIFSTPTYILYGFIYYFLACKNIRNEYAKIILISFVALGVIITTFLIKGSWMFDLGLSYFISSIIAGLSFKLNFRNSKLYS